MKIGIAGLLVRAAAAAESTGKSNVVDIRLVLCSSRLKAQFYMVGHLHGVCNCISRRMCSAFESYVEKEARDNI